MCGQAGLLLGSHERTRSELSRLTDMFTCVLKLSEQRGHDATGAAWVKSDGTCRLHKNAVPAREFIRENGYRDILDSVDNNTTVLMGHTRWATVGAADDPNNAQPIRAGVIHGTHNGTVTNADLLFRRFSLPRHAEVDSEVIFRLADRSVGPDGRLNIHSLAQRLNLCKGSMAAVMVTTTDPGRVVMVKRDKPLEMMYNKCYGVIFYASDVTYLKAVIGRQRGWFPIDIPRNALVVVDSNTLRIADIVPMVIAGKAEQ